MMLAGKKKNIGSPRSRHATKMMGIEGCDYRRMFNKDEEEQCFVLKKLKPTTERTLGRKAVSDSAPWFGVAQQASNASLQSTVRHYNSLERRSDKRHRAGSSDSGGERGISEGPEPSSNRKK